MIRKITEWKPLRNNARRGLRGTWGDYIQYDVKTLEILYRRGKLCVREKWGVVMEIMKKHRKL